jgi:Rrf2 family transcriptional regulator, iron-sulfur cluster assembly transcription factor
VQLPQTAEYALRAMAELATLPDGETLRAGDLAARTNVPSHYMAKVLRRLVAARLLDVQRGPGGGFRLARAPSRIRFSEIFDAVDASPSDGCAFGFDRCDARQPCPLHPTWSVMKEHIRIWETETTLADVRATARHLKGRR